MESKTEIQLLKEELKRLQEQAIGADFRKAISLVEEIEENNNKTNLIGQDLRVILDTIPFKIFWKDLNGNVIGCNQACKQFLTRKKSGEDEKLLYEEIKAAGMKYEKEIISGSKSKVKFLVKYKNRKGHTLVFRIRKIAILDKNNELIGVLETHIDITKRESLRNELENTNSLLITLLDTTPGAVFWKDENFRFKYGNKRFLEVVGYNSLSDILGKSDYELKWAKEESDRFRTDDLRLKESRKPILNIIEQLTTAEGKTIWLKTHKAPVIDEHGDFKGLIGIIDDITESRNTKIALKHSEARLKSYFDSSTDGIIVMDHSFIIQQLNPSTEQILGYGSLELIGKNLFDVFYQDENLDTFKNDCLHIDIEPVSGECTVVVNNINLKYLKVDVINIEIDHYLCLVRDISELKRAIKKAEESNRLKTAFLQNISHEIRTPLNAIIGFSNILFHKMYDNEQDADNYKKIIYTNSEYLLSLIDSVIDLSKIESGQTNLLPKQINLIDFISNDIMPVMQSEKERLQRSKVQIVFKSIGINEEAELYVDPNRLKQIIVNLLHNALKFTLEGSVVLSVKSKGVDYVFKVTDTGIGIDKEQLARIFHRFYKVLDARHMSMGSGLGLAIVKKLLNVMGGTIKVESEIDKGTEFTFTIPKIYMER